MAAKKREITKGGELATAKERAYADKFIKRLIPINCKPVTCDIIIKSPCVALVQCNPMKCGLDCGGLKSVP